MAKNANNTKKFKLKRIPVLIFTLGLALVAVILTFSIYLGVSFNNAKIEPLLKSKFNYTETPTMVKADSIGTDGTYSTSVKDKKYSYSSKVQNLKIGLVCTNYTPVSETNTTGSFEYYIGFNALTSSDSIKVESCQVLVAEKWTGYASSTSTVSSSYYNSTYLDKEVLTFSSTRSISVTQKFPKRFILGMHKVSNPKVFVYVKYTDKKESKSYIISYDFDDYFISGQSIMK